jgi:endonuclease/exonuclease/phosphatase family metal-dependent hydrolase
VKPLRFLCFNIHGGRSLDGKRDLARVHALMDRLDIDVGVFQEMETRTSRGGTSRDVAQLSGPDRPFHFVGPSLKGEDGWYGNLIVSRYEITRGTVHNLETSAHLEPRNAVDVLIKAPHRPIRVIGTHLSLSYAERRQEALNLLRLAEAVEVGARHPTFVMGDINEWQWGSRLIRHLNGLMTPIPCGATFPSRLPFLRLDRAWHDTPGITAKAIVQRGGSVRMLSDHLPVLIEVAGL